MIALGVRPWPGASGERRLRWATAAREDDRTGQPHWTTVRHDGGMARPSPPASFPKLLAQLPGQTIVHTRVAARGTWTVTTRGWVLHSRIQDLPGGPVGLRDPRAVGAAFEQVRLEEDELVVALRPTGETSQRSGTSPRGGEILSLRLRPAWEVTGPRRARAGITARGERWEEPPGPPLHASPEQLAAHRASTRSGIEDRLLATARDRCVHPGHVVEVLAAAGAVDEEEFARRGPLLLARMLARGELQAGFLHEGRFRAWDLPLEEVIEHIGTTWTAIGGRTPDRDMIAWFALTPAGRASLGPRSAQALPPGMAGYDSPGVVGGAR